eukprot:NODE_1186_length_1869_cov_0.490395.p1 type:complete len:221 gc:universal NODE_1186_length_1869_cov_0.490395:568-1230(+)
MFLQKRDSTESLSTEFSDHVALFSTSAVFLIIAGILLVVRGYKLYRIAIMLASGVFLASVSVSIALSIDQNIKDTTLLIIGIVTGVLGAIIGYKFYRFCLTILGALAGIYLANVILALKQPILIESQIGRIILVIALAIVGAVLINKVEKVAVVGATSIIGSYFIMLAIDLFANWGFRNAVMLWKTGNFEVSDDKAYILIAGFILVSIFGFVIQRRSLKS